MSHHVTVLGPVKGKFKAECRSCTALRDSEWTTNLDKAVNEAAKHQENT